MQNDRAKFKIIFIALILAGFFGLAKNSLAAPAISSVSGSMTHGQNITISGSGFGTKSPAKPYLWADFNNGSLNPSNLGIKTSWSEINKVIFEAGCGPDGTGCARDDYNNISSWDWTLLIDTSADFYLNTYSQKYYLYRKTKRNFSVVNKNWKIWRVWSAGLTYPNIYIQQGNGSAGTEGCPTYCWGSTSQAGNTNWMNEEIVFQANTAADLNNTFLRYYIDSTLNTDCQVRYFLSVRNGQTNCSSNMVENYVMHGVMANEGSPGVNDHYWVDDIYVDTTWARIMICAGSTWDNRGHCEIQIPLAWSDTSATIAVNAGTLTSANYLYVVDNTNAANISGYLVSLSGSGDTAPPAAPTGVAVQ